jgi:nucleotide-binding universal stress UspA family protein
MGIGRHRPVDRLIGAGTVLRTLRTVDCPVLAVTRSLVAAPASAAVGVDFSPSSANAAQSAARLLAPGGTLHLVHVWQPLNSDDAALVSDDDIYRQHLPQRFRRFIATLALPARIDVKCEVREGPPAERLTDFADAHQVDVIAVGRHGRNPLQRLLVGGVAERVLRSANRSVLIAPEPTLAQLPAAKLPDGWNEHAVPRTDWKSHLDDFARRNAGHVVSLAVNDPEHGITSQERGYILFGTSFEDALDVMHIAIGEINGRREHLARTVRGATGLSIMRNALGEDMALRVVHGRGETVLTLTPVAVRRGGDATTHAP